VGDVAGAAAAELIEEIFDCAQNDGEGIFLVDSLDASLQVLECIAGHIKEGVDESDNPREIIEDMVRVMRLMLENVVFGDPEAELEAAGIECVPGDDLDEDGEGEEDEPTDSELMSEIDEDDAEAKNIPVLTPTPPRDKDKIN